MRRFVFRCFVLSIALFVGVLLGMNRANQGMTDMKGYSNDSFQTPAQLVQTDDGQVEAMLMGNEVASFNLDEKKERLEERKSFNIFAEAGKLLADVVSTITKSIMDFIVSLI